MPAGGLVTIDDDAVRDRHARGLQHHLGEVLLHGQRRSEHAGMGVGNAQDFQHALDRAVLADPPVQRIEGDVGLEPGEHFGDVAVDVDAGTRDSRAPPARRRSRGPN